MQLYNFTIDSTPETKFRCQSSIKQAPYPYKYLQNIGAFVSLLMGTLSVPKKSNIVLNVMFLVQRIWTY